MSGPGGPAGGDPYAGGPGAPGEDERVAEQRAAYEAELDRVAVPDMLMQATVTLLNLAARRLAPGDTRDLEQARDAIDGVRALLEILDRRIPGELGPLREAVSQLQLAYAAEAGAAGDRAPVGTAGGPGQPGAEHPQRTPPGQGDPGAPGDPGKQGGGEGGQEGPGPAESSGRLWVPGR